ncbi:MAG: MFS transporter [Chloroflexi bacterium]|nr:MFS transporter [Chloroflexota bacterium]
MNAPVVELEKTEHRNYTHLIYDMAWFGLALAATSRFLSVYAIRLGATPVDLGWISSAPALVLMLSASAAGLYIRRFRVPHDALIVPGIIFRLLFLLPVFAPLLPRPLQPLWLIASVTLPAFAQGVAGVAFLIAMRQSVRADHMTSLLGRRALALNAAIAVGALGFGLLLEQVVFPTNYQVMFLTAFGFALVSMWHVSRVHHLSEIYPPQSEPVETKRRRLSIWRNPRFRSIALVTAVVHLSFFAIVPITPLFLVERLGADEGFMAIFGMLELFAGALMSVLATRIINRIGTASTIAIAMVGTALAAFIIALSPSLPFTLIAAFLSGGSWTAAASVGLMSLYMKPIDGESSTAVSTGVHQAIGLSMFIGPMVGSLMANQGIDLLTIIMLGAGLRLAAAAFLQAAASRRQGGFPEQTVPQTQTL